MQSSIAFEKPGILSKQLKTLMSSNYHRVEYFWLKFFTRFSHIKVNKRVFGILLLCLDLDWIPEFFTLTETRFFTFLLTQDLNK